MYNMKYRNGNYNVTILEDGTKIRHNKLDCFIPEKPESMDIKITKTTAPKAKPAKGEKLGFGLVFVKVHAFKQALDVCSLFNKCHDNMIVLYVF